MKFLKFEPDKCNLCGACIDNCPFDAIAMESDGIRDDESALAIATGMLNSR